ncbi:hypothetical protein I6A60_01900 [Frankia sp. AgB1.9]|uniref:hypothetical protein n=1 Tax=unclassified Frankia TaxID=2632575 RepID=UPI001932924C|nr:MULTISPECIES: hypothetical protein [unclassified Frankia]MBL7494467.1 hypothetical protein [Frankia sp. AgW1.1]MBL7546639.1 hypothetical protein [Frankia sp. AgB1.9]MBL7618498.1 hypothetical protein [Frankia sp. AgB1.8]
MGLKPVLADVALPSAARTTGTFTSGPVAPAGAANEVLMTVHATAVSGTPTLDVSLEQSADGSSWSAIPGSSAAQLTAAGNRVVAAAVTANYVRVTSAVGGTTPSVTYSVGLWLR